MNNQIIDDYYSENYYLLINYLMNKKGKGKVGVVYDAAVEVLHDTYIYHRTHHKAFNPQYIWNILKQRRIDYLREGRNYDSLKQAFFNNYYEGGRKRNPLQAELIQEELYGIIREEINTIKNRKTRLTLKNHYIIGNRQDKNEAGRKLVYRFRQKMVDKYGEIFR